MTAQEYWDTHLTHRGRIRALYAIGRALGWQTKQWEELPPELRERRLAGRGCGAASVTCLPGLACRALPAGPGASHPSDSDP